MKKTDAQISAPQAPPLPIRRNDRLNVQSWPIDKLYQRDGAPRRFTRKETDKAASILREFGLRLPLVITSQGEVLSHFVVVTAARSLGYDELPVVVADDLSKTECDRLSLALTRLYELGKFDNQMLGQMMLEIETAVPDVSFDDLGFDAAEVDRAIGSVGLSEMDQENPPILAKVAVSIEGDVWLCGRHRIGCGDAADPQWLQRLSKGPIAMVSADPPYGCQVSGFVTSRDHPEFVQASGDMTDAQLKQIFLKWCEAIRCVTCPGALVYLYIDWRSCSFLMEAAGSVLGPLKNMAVWVKNRAGMGSFYRSQHELVLIYQVPGAPHRNNVQLGKHGRNRTNVWHYDSAMSFARSGTEGDLLDDHPTPKNKEMIADTMLDATKRGDKVLDPFLGSGSTLIAAEKAGRICCGSDLDPLYVDLAVRRWQAWTGKQATHAISGRTFDELAASNAQHGETGDE